MEKTNDERKVFIPDEILTRVVPGSNEKTYPIILKNLEAMWTGEKDRVCYDCF